MSFLYWLESIRCPFLDAVMQAFTCFGEELAFLLLALTIFWCVSKEEGYYLLFVGFFGTVLNQFLKLLCRIPRPWVRDPDFTIVESARSGAGGYSFPSGHTQNAVGTLDFATCMLTESTLSYLGFGVTYPRPTWGNMLNGANNSTVIKNFWWRWLFPAIFLAITCICINIVGDTLRDVMDPKSDRDK